jgi:hypothetical protein
MILAQLPVLPSELCACCNHYNFGGAYDSDYTTGKCWGYPEEEVCRYTNSEKTCDRFELDYSMALERLKFVDRSRFKAVRT